MSRYNRDGHEYYGRELGREPEEGFLDERRSWGWSPANPDRGRPFREARRGREKRGPKGYTRPDERIREDVCDLLSDHPWVDSSDVEVSVKEGEVTLTGQVVDRDSKRAIEDVADGVSGVRDVHNQLVIRREAPATPPAKQPS